VVLFYPFVAISFCVVRLTPSSLGQYRWHPGELCPRIGFSVTNLVRPAERIVAFYNHRGTCEQYIREGKGALKWTRLSPAVVCSRLLMREGRSATLSAQGLCEVTVLVQQDCAERIQQFAHELRARQHAEPLPTRLEWQIVSPIAELVVSRDCSAHCVVRDTRAAGEDRFRWTVAVLGQLGPIAEGRAENRVEPARPAGGNVRLSER
jgi:hypothetical protein